MKTITRITDAKARGVLPKSFANTTVILEQPSDTEVRIRRAKVVAEDDLLFAEEASTPLSNPNRDHFLSLLAPRQPPTPALKAAATRYKARRG